jgi:hypothetical protein
MLYELVELSTGNVVGCYETDAAALRDVAASIRRYGLSSVESLALGRNDADGDGTLLARGLELARWATAPDGARQDTVAAQGRSGQLTA